MFDVVAIGIVFPAIFVLKSVSVPDKKKCARLPVHIQERESFFEPSDNLFINSFSSNFCFCYRFLSYFVFSIFFCDSLCSTQRLWRHALRRDNMLLYAPSNLLSPRRAQLCPASPLAMEQRSDLFMSVFWKRKVVWCY